VSNASSSGNVTWTEAVAVSDVGAGVVDAAGDGAVGATAMFELFGGPGVQPINKQAMKARLIKRRITMFWLLLDSVFRL
jgi:hypothetical protein